MRFTVIFDGAEGRELSFGLLFMPTPVWARGGEVLVDIHAALGSGPQYPAGGLRLLLERPPLADGEALASRRALVVVHESGHGSEDDLAALLADLAAEGFAAGPVRFPKPLRKRHLLSLDASPENADWTKETSDIGVATRAELDDFLRRQGMTLEEFKRLPLYRFSREYWDGMIDGGQG